MIISDGRKLEVKIRMWSDYVAVDQDGTVILDFTDSDGNNVSTDVDGMPVTLKGFSYVDREGRVVFIEDEFYEDDEGRITQPDTFTGEYSDMPHVLSFLQLSYEDVFNILMQDETIVGRYGRYATCKCCQAGIAGSLLGVLW